MQKKILRPPYLITDKDGSSVYRIPLAGTELQARMHPEDWHKLIDSGITPNWYLNKGGVSYSRRIGKTVRVDRVARAMLGITDSQSFVRFHDKNPLNLRRENLYVYTVKTPAERDRAMSRKTFHRMSR